MRFGVFLPAGQFPGQSHGEVLLRTIEAAEAAERAGFDDVWVAEHHFMSYGVCPSAATLAGYLLGVTSRVDVGTAVSVLSNQHPVALAEQAALLSLVSGGRFRLGVGRGGPWVDLEVFGTGVERFEEDFAESLDLLMTWLSSERVSWSGTAFRFREVPVVPRPAVPPPVVVACTSPATEALAASRGLPMLLGLHVGDAEKAAAVARYAEQAARHAERTAVLGRPTEPSGPVGHVATGLAHVADTRDEAVRAVCRELPRWLGPGLAGYVAVDDRPRSPRDPREYARLLCGLHPVGTPDDCVAALTATVRETGIGHLILMVDCTGSRERTVETIARLGAEVLPRVRAATSTGNSGKGQVSSRAVPEIG
jgi:alkanesulfonate monooxygenase SsuD/methylene tetrahydromethanopterin reductase-like flavin-dependent oxidoreductase (luciferase family)